MNVYKLGNKVKCIIRSFSSGKIGTIDMQYANQPYTVLSDVEANLSFRTKNRDLSAIRSELNYSIDYADVLKISNVKLSDRILNLIFSSFQDSLCHISENYTGYNGQFYLPFPKGLDEIYQLFIYNADGKLVKAEGTCKNNKIIIPEDLNKEACDYLVFYSYPGKGYNLQKNDNFYLSLDLEIQGNQGDSQSNTDITSTYWVHLNKCALEIDKNLYFRGSINTIDLTFKILHSNEDYITIE